MGKTIKKYFPIKGNKFLFTDNNWKDFSCADKKSPGSDYMLENNRDVVTKIRLKYEFGDKVFKTIFKKVKEINRRYFELTSESLPSKVGYGHEFEILSISVIHDISIDEVINKYIIKGTEDGQIDAIYYTSDKAVIYQIKMGVINDDAITSMRKTILDYNRDGLL